MKSKKFLIAMIALITLGSCSKSDTAATPAKTKTVLLTQKGWKTIKFERSTVSANGPWTDVTFIFPPCGLDDINKFEPTGNYVFNEGLTKCDIADPQIKETGTWSFLNNETAIQMINSRKTTSANISSIDENNLVLVSDQSNGTNVDFVKVTNVHP
jgi:hypothetical protein